MPLIKSASDKAKAHNIKAEMASNKPRRQAVAIALDVARRARANGGDVLKGFKVPDAMFKKGPMGTSMAPVTGLAPKAVKPKTASRMPRLNKYPKALKTQATDTRRAGFADGGAPSPAPSGDVLVGPVVSAVPGRTDKHPVSVLSGSYVLPSSHVASLGEDNTLAGMKVLAEMFPNSSQPAEIAGPSAPGLRQRADGGYAVQGSSGERIQIIIAGGEFVVHPDDVIEVGDGNLDRGHKELDKWVLSRRKKHIKTLQGLAPPAKD